MMHFGLSKLPTSVTSASSARIVWLVALLIIMTLVQEPIQLSAQEPEEAAAILQDGSGFPAQNVELVGRALGGGTFAVTVQGNRAYLGTGFGLIIVDIADPARPRAMSQLYLPGVGNGIVVSGNLAYVAGGQGGLRIIDVSNPMGPVERGFFDTPGSAESVAVVGSLAYVADSFAGLFILQYTGPSSQSRSPSGSGSGERGFGVPPSGGYWPPQSPAEAGTPNSPAMEVDLKACAGSG